MKNIKGRNYLIIINPRSGNGSYEHKYEKIKVFLDENNVNYEIKKTEKRGDAEAFARNGSEQGFTHIISVGGDGTSSEIVNAIYDKDIVFSVIPSGSGNDFPRALSIPDDLDSALENILFGNELSVDIGRFRDRCFINGLGIGLDGAVAKRFKYLKKLGAFPGYLVGAIIEAFMFKGFPAKLPRPRPPRLGPDSGPNRGPKGDAGCSLAMR